MSRYRKIEVRMWADEKIRRLSGFKPSGLALWMYLLTGPHTGPIPGLFRVSEAGMAEELGWDLKAFREAFREVFQEGLIEASLESHLLWIPNAIRYNKPESPNVIRSWRTELDILPECPLKTAAVEGLFSFIKSLGKPYEQAFLEIAGTLLTKLAGKPLPKPSRKASRKASGNPSPNPTPNQEQEQEQEQEKVNTRRGCARDIQSQNLFAPPDGGCVVRSEPVNPVSEKAVERETCPIEPEPADTNAATVKPASKVHKVAKVGIHHQDAIDTLLSHNVPQLVIDDYLAMRTSRKAALTHTAVKIFLTQVSRSGWTPEQALSECCVRGWTGFRAEWVANLSNSTASPDRPRPLNRQESLEARNRAIGEQVCAEMMREFQQAEAANQNQPGDFQS